MTQPSEKMQPELKPCPFCGNQQIVWLMSGRSDVFDVGIGCDNCEVQVRRPSKELALRDWNSRADLTVGVSAAQDENQEQGKTNSVHTEKGTVVPSTAIPKDNSVSAAPIYVASRASVEARGRMWRGLRDRGICITSTWIDEDSEGATDNMEELWLRITNEIAKSVAVVLYAETSDFPLKGAFIEAGIALGMGKPVVVCLPSVSVEPRSCRPIGSWINHPLVSRVDDINAAVRLATAQPEDDRQTTTEESHRQASSPNSESSSTQDERVEAARVAAEKIYNLMYDKYGASIYIPEVTAIILEALSPKQE